MHLAAALLLHESRRVNRLPDMLFLAADEDLLQAAADEVLCTENPNGMAESPLAEQECWIVIQHKRYKR